MNTKTLLAAAILGVSTAASATAGGVAHGPGLTSGWFANRLVGTYQSVASVGACGSTPSQTHINTMSFNAQGTVIESPRFPPAGVQNLFGIPGLGTRTIGLGSWSYNRRNNTYSMTLRFDFFVNGGFRGTGVIERELKLSLDQNTASGSVHGTMYAADGSVILEQCGTAVSTRL